MEIVRILSFASTSRGSFAFINHTNIQKFAYECLHSMFSYGHLTVHSQFRKHSIPAILHIINRSEVDGLVAKAIDSSSINNGANSTQNSFIGI